MIYPEQTQTQTPLAQSQTQTLPFLFPPLFPIFPVIPDHDLFINSTIGTGVPGPQGPQGPQGEQGPQGPQGEQGDTGPSGSVSRNTVVVSEDYTAKLTDYYIGVNNTGPITITLPDDAPKGTEYIIKLQIGAPVGNRKVTVKSGTNIDNVNVIILTNPYEALQVLFQSTWHITNRN
jgi:hypothetical protein